jgi:prolyl oligopeptidase
VTQCPPPAERLDLVEDLHGYAVADPYRWLEDPADPRTVAWSAAQDELARAALDALPGRAALEERLRGYLSAGSVSVPLWRAGRRFLSRRLPGQEHSVVHLREADGTERPLLDPIALDPTGLTTLDAWVPDLEGRRIAYQVSRGGDEQSVLHVLDVDSGELVEEPIDRCRYSAVAWLPGGEEFFYVRKVAPGEVPAGEEDFHRRIWRHTVGGGDTLVDAPGLYDGHTYYGVRTSRDGRWLVVTANVGTARRDSVWVGEVGGELVGVLTQSDDVQAACWVERDGRLYVHTTDGAPRWKLAVADPARPQRSEWRDLVPEDPGSVLLGVRYLEPGTLVLARARHAVAELALHALDGTRTGEIPLPGTGSLTGLTVADRDTPTEQGKVWIGWTDLVTPPQVHRFEGGETVLEATAPGQVELPAVRSALREFTSKDGTTVRMFVVTPEGPVGPFPTLMTGYGGFSLAREPAYTSSALAWVASGGAYALVGLRGGSEEGEAWHLAGNRAHKQNVFDDFAAAAESLLASGTASRIGIQGGSNGGLLVGAALTQRPELYAAVVCSAPLLDMVRYELFSLGRTWNDEYGTAEDPVELGWLLGYSPYHHVREGVAYPPTLFTVFDSDSRVDPLHARKMCAALQYSTTGGPVLLRRETEVGHGARSISRTVALSVDTLAFLAHHTGLTLT